jgi:hypothetical protein
MNIFRPFTLDVTRWVFVVLLLASFAYAKEPPQEAATIPTPRSVLGFDPGDDRKLADWSQIVDYFKRLDSSSERVSVHQAGLSTQRRPFIYALISSRENITNLSRIRENQRKLADPRLIAGNEERERLILETPAIVAITCSIHSTEIVASQMSMELAYQLASDNSPATAEVLKNAVLLLVPSVNPDGIDIVTNWYRKTLGTKFEGTNPPVLYHHYTGHDNNRDWFMLTQVETQMVSALFWREWFPEIVYDVHQQGQYGSRMCVPPFFDPQNPNIDPVILRQVGAIGMRMAAKLDGLGFKGIVTNSTYDTWWHGGLRTAPYYHNAVGILTEAASARIATPLEIKPEQLRSSTRGLQNPLIAQTNFPDPWEGGRWSMRDILKMELITTRTVLEEASLHRAEIIRNFVGAATRAIEAGKSKAPFAYVVPNTQNDPGTADKLIDTLIQQGVEVHRAKAAFTAGGRAYEKGSYVILMSQPYRANVKCLFEPQKYPDRRLYPNGPAEPPYDVAGWTLPMQMGVDYDEAATQFAADLERVDSAGVTARIKIPVERGVTTRRIGLYRSWVVSMDEGWTRWVLEQFGFDYTTISDADVRAGKLQDKFDVIILPDQSAQQIINGNRAGTLPDEYCGGITEAGVGNLRSFVEGGGVLICLDSASELAIKRFDLPVRNALEGLKRDQFYAPGSIFRARIDNQHPLGYGMRGEADLYFVSESRRGRGSDPDAGPTPDSSGPDATTRPESPSRSASTSPDAARRESEPGGDSRGRGGNNPTADGAGNSSQSARREDTSTLVNAFAFEVTDPQRARSVARFVEGNPLRSGWLLGPQYIAGKSALVDASLGKGRVVLFGFRPQHRAQTWGTFKLLFNAILLGAAKQ